tara:strand:- start:1752 stop:2090 length:339 start_codon:yes stop_codon:yes gene_type:complete
MLAFGGSFFKMSKRLKRKIKGTIVQWNGKIVHLSRSGVWTHEICDYLCTPDFGWKIAKRSSDTMKRNEKDFPTLSTQAPKQAWFPQAHVHSKWTQCFELSPTKRPKEALRQL